VLFLLAPCAQIEVILQQLPQQLAPPLAEQFFQLVVGKGAHL
jgi:hypothetical protein